MLSSRKYPLQYGAGLFLCCVGAGFVLAVLTDFSKANLYFGLGGLIGTLGYVVTWRRSVARHGKPRIYQYLLIAGVIALQSGVFSVLGKSPWVQSLSDYRQQLLVLSIVAFHFMLMYWALGRWIVWLGIAGLLWTAAAAVMPIPVPTIVLVFGSLEILFGAVMAAPILAKPPTKASAS